MKEIQPVNIWVNGEQKQAVNLGMYIINDNLSTSATFYYQLFDEDLQQLAQGNLTISGTDYDNWNANPNINDAAYTWAATQLNLTLV